MKKSDEQTLVQLLKQLEPGYFPYDIFLQLCRLVAVPIVEIVPFRLVNDTVEVLLLERERVDDLWSGEVHTPGTVVRSTDAKEGVSAAFGRILKEELHGVKTTQPHFVTLHLHASKRGTEQSQIYWVEVQEEPSLGRFYPVHSLPSTIIETQLSFIEIAAKSFYNHKLGEGNG